MESTKTTTKKITLATVKSFVKKNADQLYIDVRRKFDGMIDGERTIDDGFSKAAISDLSNEHTLGVSGAWFVGSSRDYFNAYDDENYTGIKVYNCCGSFILAIKKS